MGEELIKTGKRRKVIRRKGQQIRSDLLMSNRFMFRGN